MIGHLVGLFNLQNNLLLLLLLLLLLFYRLELITPPMIPTIVTDGDTGNFDIYPPEGPEEAGHLTLEERQMFREFDVILDRPIQE